jgi:hypothetical protein
MGRGRAKAKQTRVARELKYHSPDIDLDRLRADLDGGAVIDESDDDLASDGVAAYGGWADVYDGQDEASRSLS